MSKNIMFTLIFLFLLIPFVYGYSNTSLKAYYTFGDGNTQTIYDTHTSHYTLGSTTSTLYSITGKVGNALESRSTTSIFKYNNSINDYDNTDISINQWIKDDNGFDDDTFRISTNAGINTNYNVRNEIVSNTTNIRTFRFLQLSSSVPVNTSIIQYNVTQWHMFTMTYAKNTGIIKAYIDGKFIGQNTISDLFNYGDYPILFTFANEYSAIDESSIWYSELNSSDVAILYNSGIGLNYVETMASGLGIINNSFNETETNFTYPYYYDYCINERLCEQYQANTSLCLDEINIICPQGCNDTSEYWNPLIPFGGYYEGYCINNISIITLNSSTLIYHDICIPYNVLCYNLNITDNVVSCPITYNAQLNRISCISACNDEQDYYNNLGMSPIGNNFSGTCGLCSNECQINNTQCNRNYLQTCTLSISGCSIWTDTNICFYGCSNGVCTPYSSTITTGTDTECDASSPLNDGTMFSCVEKPIRNVISLIILIIIAIIILVGGFTTGINSKIIGSLLIAFEILAIFTLIGLGGIEWYIGLIIAIITAGFISLAVAKFTSSAE